MKKITEVRKYGNMIWELLDEQEASRKLLNSKRYRIIDNIIDSTYKILKPPFLYKKNQSLPQIKSKENTIKNIKLEFKDDKKRVDIINFNFYDWDGKKIYKGGAERYVYDLAVLLQKLGYHPQLLQCSNKPFKKYYEGIPVIGTGFHDNNLWEISKNYKKLCRGAQLIIASPTELACEMTDMDMPIITINHGVNFDSYKNNYKNVVMRNYIEYMESLANCYQCVCVDTNYINWVRTKDNELSLKTTYIPNYCDDAFFNPRQISKNDRITCVFPRRICPDRGSDITIEAFDHLLKNFPDKLCLKLVGQINNKNDRKCVNNLIEKYPNNVFHITYDMNDMPKAYAEADVVLIPTRCSEGTSLSCIEGMASGTTVIASNVGGLPNLIIDNYNGLLISPTAHDLENAIEKLIKNQDLMKKLSKNAVSVARSAFQKKLWEERWTAIIKSAMSLN